MTTRFSIDTSERYQHTKKALRLLCSALLALVFGVVVLLLAHESSQAQTATAGQGIKNVGTWLPIPYPRTPEMTSDPDLSLTDEELAALMDKAVDAGVSGVEVQADWWLLEPNKDAYYWAYTDRFMDFAEERGLKVGMQLSKAPPWVSPEDSWTPPRDEADLADWRDFSHDLVERYGTRVTRYEMWNEPNLKTFFESEEAGPPDPADYAALLRAGYLGAKAANPNARVTGPMTAYSAEGYMEKLYAELRKYPDAAANDDFFDELAVHPYSFAARKPYAPDSTENLTWQEGPFGTQHHNFWGYRHMRDLLVRKGDSHKKIYLGEFGYGTKPHWAEPITDEQRAAWLKKAFEVANGDASYLSGLEWYSYYTDVDRGYNIVDPNTLAESATFKALTEVLATGTSKTLTFEPVADAHVQESSPKRNFGASNTLATDWGTKVRKVSYLKFKVSGVGVKRVQSATLRLYVKNGGGSANGPGVRQAANTWTEGGVNWSNRPAYRTPLQADKRAVAGSSWMTFNVKNLVAADGTVTLAVEQPNSKDETYTFSREGTKKPQLVLRFP